MTREQGLPFADRYRLLQRLGVGATATVYVAIDAHTGQQVAVKVLHNLYAGNRTIRRRFVREAKAAKRLSTPHAIRVFDVVELSDGRPVVVMELLAGATLAQVMLNANGPLAQERALFLADQIASALQDAHANNVVHRDLKPENVFVLGSPSNEWVKVVDFGISKLVGEAEGSQLTGTGMLLGTPTYMALEQVEGQRDVDHRVDVYALGVVLFEMLSGVSPHAGASNFVGLLTMLRGPTPLLSEHRPELPAGLVNAVAGAMASERNTRISSMQLLRFRLAPFWSGKRPVPPGDGSPHDPMQASQGKASPDKRSAETAMAGAEVSPQPSGLPSSVGPSPARVPPPSANAPPSAKPPKSSR
ncbi:MAG: serine/threonine protein kinase [Polyangiaceae bacterium]|jgi:serine/threonine-protein kinase|nr:serine/threonine protein kinase [Polyangiaceae bacterium]